MQLEVFAQGGLGVHRHGRNARRDLLGHEAGGGGLEAAGQVALGIDLAGQDPAAVVGGQLGQCGGHGGLADATLAGDEDQFEVEQVRCQRRHPKI